MTKRKLNIKQLNWHSLKYIFVSFILIINVNSSQLFAQSAINFGAKAGGAKLLGEIPKGFSEVINEFENKTGFSAAFEISKYLSQHIEIGADLSYSNLNGNTSSPEFSAEGIQAGIPAEINDPVEYINNLSGLDVFFRYYFKPTGEELYVNPFIMAGGGYINYKSKFKYMEAPDDDLIFGKGKEGYTNLSTPVFFIGAGLKTSLSENLYLVSSLDFNMVNYDFLDVIHNYSADNNRLTITGLYTEFKIGFFYTIKSPESKETKQNKNKGKKGNSSKNEHLPFSR